MARVTVEDCVLKVPNRFELVLLASQRARAIGAGAELTVERDNDKFPVVSLREIADETIALSDLKEALIKGHQKVIEVEEDEEDIIDLMEGEHEWAGIAREAEDAESSLARDDMHETSEDEEVELDAEDGEDEEN